MGKNKLNQALPPPQTDFLDTWRPYTCLAAICLLYLPTLFFNLVLLDDNLYLDKLAFLSDWGNLPAVFKQGAFLGASGDDPYYRPILILSMMLDAHLWGGAIGPYHLTNIVIHFTCCALLLSLLRKAGYGKTSFFLTLLFAAHPLLANAVAWMPARTDSLLAIFVLASFNCYMDFLRKERWEFFALHLLFFALALLSKELPIVLPALCVVYAWLMTEKPLPLARKAALGIGWAALLLSWHLARKAFLAGGGGYTLAGVFKSVFENLPALLVYLGKIFFPFNLSTYPILADSPLHYGVAAVAVFGALLYFSKQKNLRALLWGASWFLILTLPGFIYPASAITPVFYEYRVYLPLVGLLIMLGETDFFKGLDFSASRRLTAFFVLLGLLCLGAVLNSRKYKDSLAFWQNAARYSPHSSFAQKQLGIVYYFGKLFDKAEAQYKMALSLNPYEPLVHNNLGVIYMNSNRLAEAEKEYLQELSFNPKYDHALFNLGVTYFALKKRPEAAALWKKTLEISPGYLDAHKNLVVYYYGEKDFSQAIYHRDEVIRKGGTIIPEIDKLLAPHRK